MIDVRRAAERFTTRTPGVLTRHSFSFGSHYDPGNIAFSALVAHNEEWLEPGAGYAPHRHEDVEIVTWVLSGRLVHEDSAGRRVELVPGTVHRTGAGTGVEHSERDDEPPAPDPERNPSDRDRPTGAGTRFVQTWLRPDLPGGDPVHELGTPDPGALSSGALLALASGRRDVAAPVALGVDGAALLVARPGPGQVVTVPAAPHVHVFVTRGVVDLPGAGVLVAGDAARVTEGAQVAITAGSRVAGLGDDGPDDAAVVRGAGTTTSAPLPDEDETAEVLVWLLP